MGFHFNKVAIVGVGLLGGSLGLAFKKHGIAKTVVGLGRNRKRLQLAMQKGAIDSYFTNWSDGVTNAELVVICTPVGEIVRIAKTISTWLPEGSIITDVGSTKQSIVSAMDKFIARQKKEVYFVGSHPMAGSDQTGVDAARVDLFNNAVCLVTPTKNSKKSSVKKVVTVWESVGGKVIFLSPEEHDRYVAAISHLPHLIAATLVNTVKNFNKKDKLLLHLAAGGFKDTTRIASSSPELWKDICLENRNSIVQAIRLFEKEWRSMKQAITTVNSKKIYQLFAEAKKVRDQLKN